MSFKHAYVKEFEVKEDAGHWIDILRSLHNKNLLKGHYSTLKQAAANRKATQDAYETILHAKQVLTGEPCQTFKRCPGDGTDIYQAMWSKYKQPVRKLPSSIVKIASNCLDRMREIGFKEPRSCAYRTAVHETVMTPCSLCGRPPPTPAIL